MNINFPTILGMPMLRTFGAIKFSDNKIEPQLDSRLPRDGWQDLTMNFAILLDIKIKGIKAKMQLDTGAANSSVNTNFVYLNPKILENSY